MRIHIDFEAIDPPQGLIGGEGAEPPIHFDGWLGLVTSLEGLLAQGTGGTESRTTKEPR